ncbi:hypothetical protein BDN70DRAFT_899265 [Pholiota conissans]|uniref:Uncharacterized protein n=1 Tax=Pholiota conissans TaxID=109636 RepID=A0A9P5YT06_9AGAR|nr:hypothetical protein BDN70DRAFT_899265 [Pholiota conissans]
MQMMSDSTPHDIHYGLPYGEEMETSEVQQSKRRDGMSQKPRPLMITPRERYAVYASEPSIVEAAKTWMWMMGAPRSSFFTIMNPVRLDTHPSDCTIAQCVQHIFLDPPKRPPPRPPAPNDAKSNLRWTPKPSILDVRTWWCCRLSVVQGKCEDRYSQNANTMGAGDLKTYAGQWRLVRCEGSDEWDGDARGRWRRVREIGDVGACRSVLKDMRKIAKPDWTLKRTHKCVDDLASLVGRDGYTGLTCGWMDGTMESGRRVNGPREGNRGRGGGTSGLRMGRMTKVAMGLETGGEDATNVTR